MRDILIHPGFHKTGTSSIQHFLWTNRHVLAPHLSLMMLRHLKPVVKDCARFSRSRDPADLVNLVDRLDRCFADHFVPSDRPLLISSEGLAGHLPGWPGVADYGAAPTLVAFLAGYLSDRFPRARLRVICTLRDRDTWLFSAYRHHLRGTRLRADFAVFAQDVQVDLPRDAAAIAAAIAPVPVDTLRLEEATAHPLGPGGAFVARLPVPAGLLAGLRPVGRGNAGPDADLWQEFLALNRSDADDAAVAAAKEALARGAQLGGWAPA